MGGSRDQGFTIIETMLFLAISGLLAMIVFASAGAAVNVQRYKDAVNSFYSYVQGQYDLVANVQNDHDLTLTCSATGVAVDAAAPKTTVGASKTCYVVGRILTISNSGKTVTSQPVYATSDVQPGAGTDIDALQAAGLIIDDRADATTTYEPEWITVLKTPKGATGVPATPLDGLRVLIVRSPSTGTIRTFSTKDSRPFKDIVAEDTRTDVTACVDPNGLVMFTPMGVVISKDASGASGVKLVSAGC